MFTTGAIFSGGNMPDDIEQSINTLLIEFQDIVSDIAERIHSKRAIIRLQLRCNMFIVIDAKSLHVGAEKTLGISSVEYLDERTKSYSQQQIYENAIWEFGYEKPFVISFPATLLEQDKGQRNLALTQIATTYINSELMRVKKEMNLIQINPIFGPAAYEIDPRLAFVLMPFKNDLSEIYATLMKPTIESPEFGLVCKRADEIKSNRAIMEDVWKSICEARIVIADLTGLNPNVMYELGIAHTLGKETIIIYMKDEQIKFPFDISHLRRIEYANTPVGGKKLVSELEETLRAILTPERIGSQYSS